MKTTLEGNGFSKEFVRLKENGDPLDPRVDYHVRCSVNLDSALTVSDIAPVRGVVSRG